LRLGFYSELGISGKPAVGGHMKKLIFLALAIAAFLFATLATAQELPRYVVATSPTPVLNTPAFHKIFGGGTNLNPCTGVRPIEFIALTGTLFTVEAAVKDQGVPIYRITTHDYPYPTTTGYFIDSRFVKPVETPEDRLPTLPTMVVVQQRLVAALDKPYVWGGNVKDGLPFLRELYPQADPLAGVDCSGLLYEATDGFTARNTSALINFGAPVAIAGLSAESIAKKLKPLDLIAWNGHVMIVLDRDTVIQSEVGCRSGGGVHTSDLRETVRRLMRTRKPMDRFPEKPAKAKAFVVRRWYPR
jgi:hypothetical protein